MARGDVILFMSGGSWFDRLQTFFTRGPFTHSEIDLGNGYSIGAQQKGINKHPFSAGRNVLVFTPPFHDKEDMEAALVWAEAQAGKEYGYLDIVSNAFKILGIPLEIGQAGHWDCSDFVTRYLVLAGAADKMGDMASDPTLVSPNDIARAYGLISDNKGFV